MQKHLHDKPAPRKRRAKKAPQPKPKREHQAAEPQSSEGVPPEPRSGEGVSPMEDALEGEGSYTATRRYDAAVRDFIATGEVEESAREAADALDSPERESLTEAERAGKRPLEH